MRDSFSSRFARSAAIGLSRALEPAARRLDWSAQRLDRSELEAAARQATGLDDFGDPYYGEGLDRLIASLEHDDALHLIGRAFVRRLVMEALINRLLLMAERRARPEAFDRPPKPPIIITGLPRSGSTLLHRLIARLPGFLGPPFWLLANPLPRFPEESDASRQSRARNELFWWKAITPSVRAKHKMTERMPEECIYALALTFQTTLFGLLIPATGYLEWYRDTDRRAKYADYRAILQALQMHRPELTMVLKAPDHLGGLDALVEAVPEARIVQLHRDPVTVVNSFSSLMVSAQTGLTKRHEPERLATAIRDHLESELRRNLAHRKVLSHRVVDIHYDRLVADPVAAAESVLGACGERLRPKGRQRMAGYIAKHPQHRWGRHAYRGADFGLDDEETRARFRFYAEAFGLDA